MSLKWRQIFEIFIFLHHRFGHQEPIQAIDALMRERCVTAGGRDGSIRLWKIVEESHLMFTGHKYVTLDFFFKDFLWIFFGFKEVKLIV